MSSLSVGLVGLANVGKSTLFNALLKKQQAYVANFPFATIEPNIGIIPVPDERLRSLAEVIKKSEKMDGLPPEVPAVVQFVDIAGLIEGAHKGEGLGNKFLSHIRQVTAICHVVRAFSDPDVIKQGVTDPVSDFEVVKTELELADIDTEEGHKKKKNQDMESLPLFSKKPILVVLNIDEKEVANASGLEKKYAEEFGLEENQVIAVCAKVEAELAELGIDDQKAYLADLGVQNSGLERIISKAFKTLGLITFLTAGEKEVRAWTIKKDTNAQAAAGTIHTDFSDKFIKADVVNFDDFVQNNGWKACRELGKVRSEGVDYIVEDGDVIEFKVGR
ncbi:redox-regulated ATPase YchF [Candidatus Microgenomates bacterium]|nr:redox-regulated ATPase YchF [Candidatus Microgenomates bacterium]